MKYKQVIKEAENHLSEYLEMSEKPDKLVISFLAAKIAALEEDNEYLQKRLKYAVNS